MPVLKYFNSQLFPVDGLASIKFADDDDVYDVVNAIYALYKDTHMKDPLTADNLRLVKLTPPIPLYPSRTLPDRMREYAGEKEILDVSEKMRNAYNSERLEELAIELKIRRAEPAVARHDEVMVDCARENYLSRIRNRASPAPSSIAKSVTEFLKEQEDNPIYNGRPLETSGPPLAIYVPPFARLKDRLKQVDTTVVDPDMHRALIAKTGEFALVSCAIYTNEQQRKKRVFPLLERILDVDLIARHVVSEEGKKRTELDGVDFVAAAGREGPDNRAMYLCLELKNELGMNGASGLQSAYTYRKAISMDKYHHIRNISCCPSILIALAGPYICFYGAILADVFIVQRFTDYIYIGADSFEDDSIQYAAKLFLTIRSALDDLRQWYLSLAGSNSAISHLLPNPTPRADGEQLPAGLTFLDRLDDLGWIPSQAGKTVTNYRRSLFLAKLNDVQVLVKFCRRYSMQAHRLLAESNPPLAPKLHFCTELAGGVTMVVMDIVPGESAFYPYRHKELPPTIMEDMEQAVAVLHSAGLVHGDLRRSNVVVCERAGGKVGGMLIDFDWAGVDGQVCYPILLNRSDIVWADGVRPGGRIRAIHDTEMLAIMRYSNQ